MTSKTFLFNHLSLKIKQLQFHLKKIKRPFFFILLLTGINTSFAQTVHQKLGIEDLFTLAESNSRSIRILDIAEKEAQEAVRVAKNTRLPSVSASLSANYLGDVWIADRNFSNGETATMPHFGNNFALEASEVIYAGGAISNGIAIAKLQQQQAGLDKEKNRQNIRFLLIGNYLELYKLYNQEEVYLKNIEQTKKLLSDINAKQREGLALKNDIIRYELQLKSLELALIQIRNQQLIFNNQLVTVLELPQDTRIDMDTTLLKQMPVTFDETKWQETAIGTSPSLKQSKIGIEQLKHNEKIIKAERMPSLALLAGDHFDGPITTAGISPQNKNYNYWYIGLGLKYNIASIYTSGKKIKQAQLSTQKAIEGDNLLQENIQTEVKSAYIHFVESFTILETEQKSLQLANKNYETINNRYLNDLALITDMLDASNAKLNSELQVANARINILFNYYQLKKASGNL